jgi:translocator assembly and maintenance protein 41
MGQDMMIDFIFGVTHAEHWHSLNLKQFPHHYSGIKMFGTGVVTNIQERFGARMYYNPDIEVNGLV